MTASEDLWALTTEGARIVPTSTEAQRQRIAAHWKAASHALATGRGLRPFEGSWSATQGSLSRPTGADFYVLKPVPSSAGDVNNGDRSRRTGPYEQCA